METGNRGGPARLRTQATRWRAWARPTSLPANAVHDVEAPQPPHHLRQVVAVAKSQSNIERVEYLERDINVAVLRFSIQVRDRNHLAEVMRRLRRLNVVHGVRRQ